MTYKTLDCSLDERGVARLELARPEKHNAMSAEMIAELAEIAIKLGKDPDVRAIILAGQGKSFCAGADLNWMMAQIQANRETRIAEARRLALMLKTLNEMPKPLIGRIHGNAFGGGLGLIAVCDVAIGSDAASMAFTETRLGLIPATIGPYVIARMGEAHARRVFMSSRRFDAHEACSLGLLASVTDDLDSAVDAEALAYLSVAPGAVGRAKSLTRALGPRIDDDIINHSIEKLAESWESEEAAHGIEAFLSKSKPRWAKG